MKKFIRDKEVIESIEIIRGMKKERKIPVYKKKERSIM